MAVVLLQPYRGSQRDVVRALEDLIAETKGSTPPIGFAYVVIRRGRAYSVGAAGEARLQPLIARGLLALLDDELAKLVLGGDPRAPRET